MESINHSFPHRVFSRLRQKYQPISFSCELTTKCNIRCDFCTRTAYTEKGNKKEDFHVKDMADETIDRVLEELEKFYKCGIPIVFSPMGLGEPLIFGKTHITASFPLPGAVNVNPSFPQKTIKF